MVQILALALAALGLYLGYQALIAGGDHFNLFLSLCPSAILLVLALGFHDAERLGDPITFGLLTCRAGEGVAMLASAFGLFLILGGLQASNGLDMLAGVGAIALASVANWYLRKRRRDG